MTLLPAILLLAAIPQRAQTPVPATPSPQTLVRSALDLLDHASHEKTRFTYISRIHLVSYDKNGAVMLQSTRTFDPTYINNEPYVRLIQIDDKPLPPKLEAKEQKKYDDAIAKRKDYNGATQSKHAHWKDYPSGINLTDALLPGNTFSELPNPGGPERLVEVRRGPDPDHLTKCSFRYRFWISAKDFFPTHIAVDAPSDPTPGCSVDDLDLKFINVEGLPKLSRRFSHFSPDPQKGLLSTDEATYSNYRRFRTTVTIGPAHELPDSQPPADSPTK